MPTRTLQDAPRTDRPGTLPATGLVLIGTAASVRAMAGQLAALRQTAIPAGCVLIDRLVGGRAHRHEESDLGVLPPVLGHIDELIELAARYRFTLALVSIPRALELPARRVAALLGQLQIPARTVPTFEDLVLGAPAGTPAPRGGISAGQLRIDPVALVGRSPYGVDRRQVASILTHKRVLVTGAGGSIGSELCRVCAAFAPSRIILMERAENALFEIDHQLGRRFPGVERRALLHDIVDAEQTKRVIAEHRPDVVFHAAAHKHVPLMEDHPAHAVQNNLLGTRSIADACVSAGVGRLVMISSDKAVNPSSVMGATKRLAEIYIASLARRQHGTRLSMVRFGNVLASACSVIPIWSQQIAEGAPISVTDPRMTRYFMTIPEAATLVVQAGCLEQEPAQAPVYLLDMGDPIRIIDLAVRFVQLQGLVARIDEPSVPAAARGVVLPDTEDEPGAPEVRIEFTGSRPGEKLFEELAYGVEHLSPTSHPGISRWTSLAGGHDEPTLTRMIDELTPLSRPGADPARVLEAIARWVPEMRRPN